jgi:four helix bundle protein
MKENFVQEKSVKFAIRIIRLYQFLTAEKKEYVLSKQIIRSGTAIGALVKESKYAESKADFIHKLHIALKEANETDYWLLLLKETDYISEKEYQSLYAEIQELIKLLVSIIKTSKTKNQIIKSILSFLF